MGQRNNTYLLLKCSMTPKFVHLHAHSEYSLLDGMSKIKPMMRHIKEHGMEATALTDHGVMYGAVEFYKQAKDAGIKPLIGMEGYVTNVDHKLRGEDVQKSQNFHLLFLAKNLEGYKNLMTIASIAQIEGFYRRPRIDHETLRKYAKGIICTSACVIGEVAHALINDDYEQAKKVVQWHADVFGDDYYLEVQRHEYDKHLANATLPQIKRELERSSINEKKVNEGVFKLSAEFGIPVVATNDSHYIKKGDAMAQDALVCISTGRNVAEIDRMRYIDAPSLHMTTPTEMDELFADHPEVLENTIKAADKCEVELTLGQYFFPKVELPEGKTAEEELTDLAHEGLKEFFTEITPELVKRLEYELDVIINKGYAAYFLIFRGMSHWAHERLIPINTRGSAAGSLVSYCLGITTVDPIKYQLPFERFLNPFRPSAPDIDMDIADDKREEMINYLRERYGHDKVAQICTFGRMLARGAVRDVARVLGYAYETGDRISKMIPMGSQGFPMTIAKALEESPELKVLYNSDKDAKRIIDLSRELEGNARHLSLHAAGVVISPTDLTDFTPLQMDPTREKIVTQYEMHACEDVGLVKMDILGIRNLSILRESVERVQQTRGITVDLRRIPIDDKKTYEMLSRGETMGTFQLGGSGMTRYLTELQPEQIEDIMIMIALFRPGPMDNIDEYISRKKGKSPVTYYHPKMEKYLDKSLGVLVYQDDLLYTAIEIAGYDWEQVDKFRKAVGKKIPEEMAKQHVIFVEGCQTHTGMTEAEAEGLWKLFEPFQGYGFNKAHAASYGMVAYQTSYMKANYPVEYMASLLSAEASDTDKVSAAINECRHMDIIVLPPDINQSNYSFTVVPNEESLDGQAIRFGFSAIKNVGGKAIESILEARNDGLFTSFYDFFARVDARRVNKKVVESLVKVGAFSAFGNRAALMDMIDEVRAKAKPKDSSQQDLFFDEAEAAKNTATVDGNILQIVSDVVEYSDDILQNLERDLMGFSLSAPPVFELVSELAAFKTHRIDEITVEHIPRNVVSLAAVISEIRVVVTKKSNAEMAFVKIEDGSGVLDLVVFPKLYAQTRELWLPQHPILVTGKIDVRDEKPNMLVDTIETIDKVREKGGSLKITIPEGTDTSVLKNLKELLHASPGEQKAILVFEGPNRREIDVPFGITWNQDLSRKIASIFEIAGRSN